MNTTRQLALLLALTVIGAANAAQDSMLLAGKWLFQLDRQDAGVTEKWFEHPLADKISLPGSLPGQSIGDPPSVDTQWTGGIQDRDWFKRPEYAKYGVPGNFKFPYWLTPTTYYAGAAWFQRNVEIPNSWSGKRIVLFLERPHWETRVWVDGRPFGMQNSLGTPHQYDFGSLNPGAHTITIRVDNRTRDLDVGTDSHSVSDHTQGNWNGIVGRIELRAASMVWMDDLRVYPDTATKSVRVKGNIINSLGQSGAGKGELQLVIEERSGKPIAVTNATVTWDATGGQIDLATTLGASAQAWDEFHPVVYRLRATLGSDRYETTFGLRNLAADGTQFTINGNKTFIRGTLECCIFPKTGHPPTDLDSWRRIIRVCKSYGLNLIRFHSWCPPEAAFAAADELGFYYQVECSSWANSSTSLGDGKPIDKWIYEEAERIIKNYGNHPSFLLMPYGNEPGGRDHAKFLARWVGHFRAEDPRRFFTTASGWPQIAENQYHVTPDPRVQGWGGGLNSRINAQPPQTTTDYRDYISARKVPVVSHEIGQWCVYPNFDEIPKYTGYLKARNFEIYRDFLEAAGMGGLAKPFLIASGKLQTLCYKEDIESALRTPGMGGFELLDLHDFPGQGTALVGVVDPFWEDKGYVTGKEYSRFCNSTVPLVRLDKRVFASDENLDAQLEVANFGPKPLANAVFKWRLASESGAILASGQFPAQNVALGNGQTIGKISADLKKIAAPAHCKLIAGIVGTSFENDWDLWIYPPPAAAQASPDVLVTTQFDDDAQARLNAGGKVLLTLPGSTVRNFDKAPVKLGFSSIFWNTAWTGRQPPTTLGILCDPKHPALAGFPTEFHSDWQWWYLIHRAGALRLDLLPGNLQPIVRVIDDWFTARPLGLVVEGKIGPGKIIVCGFDLAQPADPVTRQMRSSLLDYLASDKCAPSVQMSIDQIKSLIVPPPDTHVRSIKASSQQQGYEAQNAIDGDPETMWHTPWEGEITQFPHSLLTEFDAARSISGFTALPRQDHINHGWIKDYAFYASTDGQNWGSPVIQGAFSNDATLKTVRFPTPVTARFVKLVALSGHADGPWASLAEFGILDAGK